MSQDLDKLAASFNAAIDDAARREAEADADTAAARKQLESRRLAERERNEAARNELLATLQRFAEGIDALRVERTDSGLVLAYRDRALSIDLLGDSAALAIVGGPNRGDRIDLDVAGEWILTLGGNSRALLPYGLQELLVRGLGMPRPSQAVSDPGPPRIKRAPRIQSSIAPPRPAVRRDD